MSNTNLTMFNLIIYNQIKLMVFFLITQNLAKFHSEYKERIYEQHIKYPMLNRYCNRVCVRMQLKFPIGHIDGFNVHSFRKIVLHFECK